MHWVSVRKYLKVGFISHKFRHFPTGNCPKTPVLGPLIEKDVHH